MSAPVSLTKMRACAWCGDPGAVLIIAMCVHEHRVEMTACAGCHPDQEYKLERGAVRCGICYDAGCQACVLH